MHLPHARGPLSGALVDALRGHDTSTLAGGVDPIADPMADADLQLALWVAYELAYQGFDGVDDRWEWNPDVIGFRSRLEDVLLTHLRTAVPVVSSERPIAERLRAVVEADDGPSMSRYLQTTADREQFRDFVACRSVYQLKEADPHTWAIPRVTGRCKAALVEIQVDEYGAGDATRMHSELYRSLMRELDLDTSYGGYVDGAPAEALALSNVMSLFGLRRDLRGALVGHLAAYEMSSSAPCRRYGKGLRRIGGSEAACAFYDAHVAADALHEQIAMHDMCGGLVEAEPQLADDVAFGAAACVYTETRFAGRLFADWDEGRSPLAALVPELAVAS